MQALFSRFSFSPGGFTRFTAAAILCVALSSMSAAGSSSEPWKDKDYKTWTQDEVRKILYESPWVKMVEVGAPWLKGPMHYLTPMAVDCDGRPDMSQADRTPASWSMGR